MSSQHAADVSRSVGCLVGLALGDAACAPFEGGVVERALWRLIGRTRDGKQRYTDDTQMSLDLAETLIAGQGNLDQQALAYVFARGYRWSRGYGPGAAKILKKIRRGMPWEQASRSVYPDGSFGNGAAMRAPVVAVIAHGDSQRVDDLAIASAEITHAHPLAVTAARLIAHACAQALHSRSPAEVLDTLCALELPHEISDKLQQLCAWFSAGSTPTHRELRRFVGVGMTATESPLAAIWFALCCHDAEFEDLLALVIKHGGDTDTIAAMAGAI